MSVTWKWVLKILAELFAKMLVVISPTLKAELNEFLTQLYLKALATENPWDDFFVGLLMDILAVPRPPPG